MNVRSASAARPDRARREAETAHSMMNRQDAFFANWFAIGSETRASVAIESGAGGRTRITQVLPGRSRNRSRTCRRATRIAYATLA